MPDGGCAELKHKFRQDTGDSTTVGGRRSSICQHQGYAGQPMLASSPALDGRLIPPGPDPSVVGYVKGTMHGSLFRIPLRAR
jgi:hypothetical protein